MLLPVPDSIVNITIIVMIRVQLMKRQKSFLKLREALCYCELPLRITNMKKGCFSFSYKM